MLGEVDVNLCVRTEYPGQVYVQTCAACSGVAVVVDAEDMRERTVFKLALVISVLSVFGRHITAARKLIALL